MQLPLKYLQVLSGPGYSTTFKPAIKCNLALLHHTQLKNASGSWVSAKPEKA